MKTRQTSNTCRELVIKQFAISAISDVDGNVPIVTLYML